jgi:hypothetical protein
VKTRKLAFPIWPGSEHRVALNASGKLKAQKFAVFGRAQLRPLLSLNARI